MELYKNWLMLAYDQKTGQHIKEFWDKEYLPAEQKVYEYVLREKDNNLSGTVQELAQKFSMSAEFMCGFLDGISEVNTENIDMEKLEETTSVKITFEFEELYKKMIEYKAEHLFRLPEWDDILSEGEQKKLYHEQKKSGTFIQTQKVGRNEPCTCGSGKKHKKCCGA